MIRTNTGKEDVLCELADNVDVGKLCRFCLAKEEELLPIFDNEGSDPGLIAVRIRACLSLEILQNDELPKNICILCHYNLEKYEAFRQTCESSEKKILRHLSRLKHINKDTVLAQDTVDTGQNAVTTKIEVQTAETNVTNECLIDVENKQDSSERCGTRVVEALQSALVAGGLGCMSDGVLSLPSVLDAQYPLTMHVLQSDGSLLVMDIMPENDDEPSRETPQVQAEDSVESARIMSAFRCRQCGLGFPRRLLLQRHLSVHSQNRGMSCPLCQKWFPSRSSLLRHERTHTGERPYACPDCPRRFGQKEILQRHSHVHLKERPFVCEVCKRGFTQRSALLLHRRSHAPPSTRAIHLHHCSHCPKVFCYASGLSRHILTHMGRVYTCLDCDKTFNDKSSKKRHARVTGHSLA